MEKSLSVTEAAEQLRSVLGLSPVDLRTYSPAALAYLGDAVYELTLRTVLMHQGNTSTHALQQRGSKLSRAAAQAAMAKGLMDQLTDEEKRVLQRGKNAKTTSMAAHADPKDYRLATGLEALFGYLYLSDQAERLLTLMREGLALLTEEPKS